MHNPRGSNNRLNENTADRRNANRAFDSQNNNRGGYNVGDALSTAATTESQQYQMRYFQSGSVGGSFLNVEWTAQHGCGPNVHCSTVLQYMCQAETDLAASNLDRIRDGTTLTSQDHVRRANNDTYDNYLERKANSTLLDRVLHETWENYDNCYYRQRNTGLYTADQNLKTNNKGYSSAIFTRQNANGGRSGYECPEERDYYPYWHPNGGWKDIAVLTSQTSICANVRAESFNVKPKNLCVEFYPNKVQKHWSRWNTKADCEKNNGTWADLYNYLEKAPQFKDQAACEANANYKWAVPFDSKNILVKECLVLLAAPDCRLADYSRENHLGNVRDVKPATYQWKLPYFPSKKLQSCVFRVRYNISTNDYNAYAIDSRSNGANSTLRNNPTVQVGQQQLKLAINTAQFGRVFQDRSHNFLLLARPAGINDTDNVYNLNVRGRRGNIVQTFPSVEYDFIPNDLSVRTNDILHIQWTGSNTNNPNDAGQGRAGTDRSNFVLLDELNKNYPMTAHEKSPFWSDIDFIGYVNGNDNSNTLANYFNKLGKTSDVKADLALYLATSGHYQCVASTTCARSFDGKLDSDLNDAPASMPGAVVRFKKTAATYTYFSSRNNAFSNRRQVGSIKVTA